MRSKTIRGGSEISIDFDPGTDMVRAEQLTWNRIGARRSDLPPDSRADRRADDAVGLPDPVGGADRRRQPGPAARLRLLRAGPADQDHPRRALRQRRRRRRARDRGDLPARRPARARPVGRRPGRPDRPARHRLQPVGRSRAAARLPDHRQHPGRDRPAEIEELVISTRKDQPLRVRDVADVKVLHQDRAMSIGFEGSDAVVITVFRRLGGNTVNISRDVAALLEENGLTLPADDPNKKPPRNIQATVVYDQADFVQTAVDNVRDAILIGGLFSVLILLAFLRSWRATLISALAIPTTLAITFLFLHWAGETLNLMSLGGLAVAIGLIIDDTVVVIENIARHLCQSDRSRAVTGSGQRWPSSPRSAPIRSRSGGRRLRRDHRGGRRLDADDGAGVRAAGVHRRRVRPVLRLAELVAVDRRAGVDGHQPDAGPGVRGQVPGRPADAGAGPIYRFIAGALRAGPRPRPAVPVADADAVAGRRRSSAWCCTPASRPGAPSASPASRRRPPLSRGWRPA